MLSESLKNHEAALKEEDLEKVSGGQNLDGAAKLEGAAELEGDGDLHKLMNLLTGFEESEARSTRQAEIERLLQTAEDERRRKALSDFIK